MGYSAASQSTKAAKAGEGRGGVTYCVGMLLDEGLVMASDSRTNAGVDRVSTFRKMFCFERPGERLLCLVTAGNLSITQDCWFVATGTSHMSPFAASAVLDRSLSRLFSSVPHPPHQWIESQIKSGD